MNKENLTGIAIIGFGQIGSSLYEELNGETSPQFCIVGVLENQPEAASRVPPELYCPDLETLLDRQPNLVLEAAHPQVVRDNAMRILEQADMMIMSVSALGDPDLEKAIEEACSKSGRSLFIPHGATLGLDGLRDGLSIWEEVSITMRKNPRNLNFAAAPHLEPGPDAGPVTLYDGPTRGVLPLFPKNVNSHATLAMATLGMDRTRSILVSDPALDESVIEIDAKGGGTSIHIERRNPIKGVTGKLTILSIYQSLRNAICRPRGIIAC